MSEKSEPTILSPLAYWQEGFLVPILVTQEEERVLKESKADCGESSLGSFARYDHDMSLWKTSQLSLLGGSVSFSETWPNAGTMQSGIVYQRHRSVPRTLETDSSLWPTPTARDWKSGRSSDELFNRNARPLSEHVERGAESGGRLNPTWVEWLMGFPLGWTDLDASETQ